MKLGDFIKKKRLDLSMSQMDFGDFVGVSFVTVNSIENKHSCGLKTLRLLSEALNEPVQKLREMMVDNNETDEQ